MVEHAGHHCPELSGSRIVFAGKGAAQTLGMMALARDLCVSLEATVNTDASAALGIVQRQGFGKLRHVSTQYL